MSLLLTLEDIEHVEVCSLLAAVLFSAAVSDADVDVVLVRRVHLDLGAGLPHGQVAVAATGVGSGRESEPKEKKLAKISDFFKTIINIVRETV